MHTLGWTGCAAISATLLCPAPTAYASLEADGSGPAIERSAMAEACGHRDASEGCNLDLLRRRLCERGYRLEWLRTENWPSGSAIAACLFREQ